MNYGNIKMDFWETSHKKLNSQISMSTFFCQSSEVYSTSTINLLLHSLGPEASDQYGNMLGESTSWHHVEMHLEELKTGNCIISLADVGLNYWVPEKKKSKWTCHFILKLNLKRSSIYFLLFLSFFHLTEKSAFLIWIFSFMISVFVNTVDETPVRVVAKNTLLGHM